MTTKPMNPRGGEMGNPSPPLRWVMSKMLARAADPDRIATRRTKLEAKRRRAGAAHVVEYFHQVDDGYSHLAAQMLGAFAERYQIQLVCHLVGPPSGPNAPEPDFLLGLSRYDAARIGPHYGLEFPGGSDPPDRDLVNLATRILAGVVTDSGAFVDAAPRVGDALWSGPPDAMQALAERYRPVPDAAAVLASGERRRADLGHYSGAMFHYGKEWYWGIDRLHHLERRLVELGASHDGGKILSAPPAIEHGPHHDEGSMTLEIFPSVRSPYTALSFDAAVDLARATGVRLQVRPVLPMVMRGVPVTRTKGVYIFMDAAREARTHGLTDWGSYCEPVGSPVERCYSLYPWAVAEGRGVELLSAFMRAAFREGINTNTDAGLRHVVEAAGLSWAEAQSIVGKDAWNDHAWREEIEANRRAMYDVGLWGVPSFRLLDAAGETRLRVWGQDRLWLVARDIQRALAPRPGP
ncbi:MAG: DsbA family protein [Gammaproteobacteria bacterium]|nr:DsbA family protein [Gammaproteobacteria bacterium]MDE0444541.1 DsbA family protein [Gammaproteobacteria bacterium]